MKSLLQTRGVCVRSPRGRPLFDGLDLSLAHEQVALIGRNGIGKSTLLEVLAGQLPPDSGQVLHRTAPLLVRQLLTRADAQAALRELMDSWADPLSAKVLARESAAIGLPPLAGLSAVSELSRGEIRKVCLLLARLRDPELLLLDEPTEDLDGIGLAWLDRWVTQTPNGLLLVSHDRRLLRRFEVFFVASESGCQLFAGSLRQLDEHTARQDSAGQLAYVRKLSRLAEREEHNLRVCRRRRRKKNVGRLRELRRATSRARLNEKRGYAQVSQGKAAKVRQSRMEAVRSWTKAARRALTVKLPLSMLMPTLAPDQGGALLTLDNVSAVAGRRCLFEQVSLHIGRERVAVTGPNGAGKTTMIEIMLGRREPTTGAASRCGAAVGSIAQGATDWMLDDSLLWILATTSRTPSLEGVAQLIVAHDFPLALAERPMRSLSPGERVRAALICLTHRASTVELLVLDEPTCSLDFVGTVALANGLATWPGGLVIATHDLAFAKRVGIDTTISLADSV